MDEPQSPQTTYTPPQEPVSAKKPTPKWVTLLLAGLVVTLAAGLACQWWVYDSDKKQAALLFEQELTNTKESNSDNSSSSESTTPSLSEQKVYPDAQSYGTKGNPVIVPSGTRQTAAGSDVFIDLEIDAIFVSELKRDDLVGYVRYGTDVKNLDRKSVVSGLGSYLIGEQGMTYTGIDSRVIKAADVKAGTAYYYQVVIEGKSGQGTAYYSGVNVFSTLK